MNATEPMIRASVEVAVDPTETFERFVDELAWAFAGDGRRFEGGPDERVVQGESEIGTVIAWDPGDRIVLEWRPASWERTETTEIECRFESIDGGTRITLQHRGWDRSIGYESDLIGWFATEVAAPHLVADSAVEAAFSDRMATGREIAESKLRVTARGMHTRAHGGENVRRSGFLDWQEC